MSTAAGPELAFIVGISFTAGMVAFFSPCCAAMMPAYVSYALGRTEKAGPPATGTARKRGVAELGAIAAWLGLLIAALALGRLALDAFSVSDRGPGGLDTMSRQLMVVAALVGTALVLVGYAARADRSRLKKALLFSALATAGFLVVFTAFAFPVAAAGAALGSTFPLFAFVVGAALVVLGVLQVTHKLPALRIPLFDPAREGAAGFFLYGIAYALASLACTFPIFLAVIAVAAFVGPGTLVAAALAYALGKGTVLTLVTVLATASPTATQGKVRKALPQFERIMAGITTVAGAYIALYFGMPYLLA